MTLKKAKTKKVVKPAVKKAVKAPVKKAVKAAVKSPVKKAVKPSPKKTVKTKPAAKSIVKPVRVKVDPGKSLRLKTKVRTAEGQKRDLLARHSGKKAKKAE